MSINDAGQIVGAMQVGSLGKTDAVEWINANMIDLGVQGDAASSSTAIAINNKGQVLGLANGHLELWQNGIAIDLASELPASNDPYFAQAINDEGVVLGQGLNAAKRTFNSFVLAPIPEPASAGLQAMGLLALCGLMGLTERMRCK